MPGKSKKGGGLEVSPYKMKGHTLPGPKQNPSSPVKLAAGAFILGSVLAAGVSAGIGAATRKKPKTGGPGLTTPTTGDTKVGTGSTPSSAPKISDEVDRYK